MKITDIDYYANTQNTWLHNINPTNKVITAAIIVFCAIILQKTLYLGIMFALISTIIVTSKLPTKKLAVMGSYPLMFLILYFVSINNLSTAFVIKYVFKVLTISLTFATLVFSTTYIDIFRALAIFLPTIILNSLFISYRAIFILWTILENICIAMRFRGTLKLSRPIYSIKVLGNALGYLIIRAIESNEKMYDSYKMRGFSDDMKFLRD